MPRLEPVERNILKSSPFMVTCVGCGKRDYSHLHQFYADLDGKAFTDYYCSSCARLAREESQGSHAPTP